MAKKKGQLKDVSKGTDQGELLPNDPSVRTERQMKYKLTLEIGEEGGDADKIVLGHSIQRGTLVMQELEHLVCEHRRNRQRILAALDNPSDEELAAAEEARAANQGSAEEAVG